MPEELRVDKDRRVVEVRSYGVVSREDMAASIASVQDIADAEGITNVLVDATAQESMPSTLDIFDLFSNHPGGVAVAVVGTKQPTAGDLEFAETVAVNRGIRIKVFPSPADAEKWLLD